MIPLVEVLRMKPEGAARVGLVEVIPDNRVSRVSYLREYLS